MGITRLEQLRREADIANARSDADADLDELGDDAEYAAHQLLDGEPVTEREQLRIRVRFHCLRLATMLKRGALRSSADTYLASLPDIERQATIEAFNAGIRG